MTPTIDTQIWEALKQAITAAAGALPIHWPLDDDFALPFSGARPLPFLSVGDTLTASRVAISSNTALDRTGIVTLAYVAPLGYDPAWYVERATDIAAGFPVDGASKYQDVCVQWGNGFSVPRVERGERDGGYVRTRIIVPWRCAA